MANKKDGELGRMRSALAELREEMTLVAKENGERVARVTALSTKLKVRDRSRVRV